MELQRVRGRDGEGFCMVFWGGGDGDGDGDVKKNDNKKSDGEGLETLRNISPLLPSFNISIRNLFRLSFRRFRNRAS